MNIDAMRWIDRYVGVPLCAIATPLVRAAMPYRVLADRGRRAPRSVHRNVGDGKHDPRRAGDAEGARATRRAA